MILPRLKLGLRWRAFVLTRAIKHEERIGGGTMGEIVARAVERVPRDWVAKIDDDGNIWLR